MRSLRPAPVLARPKAAAAAAVDPSVVPEYPQVGIALTALFSLYILVWFLEFGQRLSFFAAIRGEFLLGTTLTALAVAHLSSRKESNRSGLTKFIVTYFLFLVFHLPLSRYFGISWNEFVNHIVKYSCIALFAYAFIRNPFTLRIFVATLLLAFFKIGLEGFLGQMTGSMVWQNQGIMRLHGTQGSMFGHPNSLSGFGVGILPFVYYLLPVVERKWKVALYTLALFAVTIIIFTGSRTGYLATLALVGFAWLRSAYRGRFLAVILIAVAVGVPMMPEQYQARFMSAFGGTKEAEGNSRAARIELLDDAWALFKEHPQGLGVYAFQKARVDLLGKEPYDPHNLYLQLLVDLGAIGAIVFISFVFALLYELWKADRLLTSDEQQMTAALTRLKHKPADATQHLLDLSFMRATTSAFLAYIAARLLLGFFGHDLYEIYWWLVSGVSMAVMNMYAVSRGRTAAMLTALQASAPAGVRPPIGSKAMAGRVPGRRFVRYGERS